MALYCTKPAIIEQQQTVPSTLLVNQPVPEWKGGSVRDAIHYAADSHAAAQACEEDRSRIRKTQGTGTDERKKNP